MDNNTTFVTYHVPNSDAFGDDNFTYTMRDKVNAGPDGPDTGSVTVTILPVNDAPTFTASDPQAVNEDAGPQTITGWAHDFSPGPANESSQTVLAYAVSGVSNPSLFKAGPAVDIAGKLTYTPADDANGSSTFLVTVRDNGGTDRQGQDTSVPQTFTITVDPVNDAPTITATNPPAVNEDVGPVTVSGWATFSPGPTNESSQTLVGYTVSNISQPSLFKPGAGPAVANNGTLTYTPADNANGSSTFELTAQDSGLSDANRGDQNTSVPRIFTITVNPVNDAPSFVKGPDVTVDEDSAASSNPWATNLSKGPSDEAGQSLNFIVSNDTNSLFTSSGQPAITPLGTLTFTPAPNASGSANVLVQLQDNGGGTDTSGTETFVINVTAVNDPPVNRIGGSDAFATHNQITGMNQDLAFTNGKTLSVTDLDNVSATATYSLQLQITDGKLLLSSSDPGNATVSLTGKTLGEINTAIAGLDLPAHAGSVQRRRGADDAQRRRRNFRQVGPEP